MSTIKDQERIEELRERLYSRGRKVEPSSDQTLTRKEYDVAKSWGTPPPPKPPVAVRPAPYTPPPPPPTHASEESSMAKKSSKKYRWYILYVAAFFFLGSLIVASGMFFFGTNTISGDNIVIEVNGPVSVGGGEVLPLQIGVTNQNSVPIQSAVLIVEYPQGTQAATEEGGTLFKERMSLDTIRPGETVNVPARAIVFGEENEQKEINASIEYRVEGSNATFFKEASPMQFTISSSPVVMNVEAVDTLSSGQEMDVKVTIRSNTQSQVTDLLLSAEYPTGFRYESSDPSPTSGQNLWRIAQLGPEESVSFTITGIVAGQNTDEQTIKFNLGTASDRNSLTLNSVLSSATKTFTLEQPFIDVNLLANGERGNDIALDADISNVNYTVEFTNSLSMPVYDVRIQAAMSGSAYRDSGVNARGAFFNSADDTISWDASNSSGLRTFAPQSTQSLNFNIDPALSVSNPDLTLAVNVYGKRVQAENAAEILIGTAELKVRFSDTVNVLSDASRNSSTFSDRGPIPPVVEVDTTYTLAFRAEAGNNGVRDSSVTATLPSYVTWLSQSTGDGVVTFNPVTREVTWQIGDIDSNEAVTAAFQVSFTPSVGQIDRAPALMSEAQFRGTDTFTGNVIRSSTGVVRTELSTESGFREGNGRVVSTLDESARFILNQ